MREQYINQCMGLVSMQMLTLFAMDRSFAIKLCQKNGIRVAQADDINPLDLAAQLSKKYAEKLFEQTEDIAPCR